MTTALRQDTLYDGTQADTREVRLADTDALDRLFAHVAVIYAEILAGGGGGGGGAPTGASYVTLSANATLSNETLFDTLIGIGAVASRPVAGTAGRLYYATDDGQKSLSRDNGAAWVKLGGAGVTVVNFGALPGATDTSATIIGQSDIVAGSVVQAWLVATATADHSEDEHRIEEIDVCAGSVVAGTGFTIYAKTRNRRLYGQYSVAWRWQ